MRKAATVTAITAGLLGLMLTPLTAAAAREGYLALLPGYVKPDEARLLDEGPGIKLLFGSKITSGLNWEINLYGHRFGLPGSDEYVRAIGGGLDLNANAVFRPGQPFFLVGAGMQREEFGGSRKTRRT